MAHLTPEQERAVEARGKIVCVDAGAGSGKTRVLVHRILDLIERDGIELDRIAAITFMDKAAAEMKARLRRACRDKAPVDDPRGLSFWRRTERQVDVSRICTIHTFCSGILRENALSLEIDPDFAILTEAESEVLRSETVRSVVHTLLEADDASAHMAAAEYGPRDFFSILDELLQRRGLVDRLIDGGVSAEELAAAWERQRPLLEDELLRIVGRSRKLRYYLRELERCGAHCTDPADKREQVRTALAGFLRDLTKEQKPSRISLLMNQIAELTAAQGKKIKGELANWTDHAAYDDVKDLLNNVKKQLKSAAPVAIDPECEARAAKVTASIVHVYRQTANALRDAKRTRNALDFDDLIAMTASVLRDDAKGSDSVRARTARGLRHVLIDEFQDTDGVQYEIARHLADAQDGPDLFIVGDAKQSIYNFRGAEVDVFRQVRRDADTPLPMLGNFRAAPPVLRFIDSFFSASDLLAAVESPFHPLAPCRDAADSSHVEFLVPNERDKALIESYRDEEARMIAASLHSICDGSHRVFDETTGAARPARFGDAAILLRSLSNVHLYERALREAGVPYTLVAGTGFYARQEVIDLRNLLAVLVDRYDEMALAAFLRGPIAGLSDDALVMLAGGIGAPRGVLGGFASDAPLADAEQNARLRRARELIVMLQHHVERPLTEFLQLVFVETGLEGIVLRQFLGPRRVSNLRKAASLAESFSGSTPPNLRAFLRYLDDMAAREIREGEAAAALDERHSVTVMTVHKAKGLEFPIVYVADLGREPRGGESGVVALHKDFGIAAKIVGPEGAPVAPAMHRGITALRADEELAEQARILYVAMTRAKDHLYLCGAPVKAGSASWMGAFDAQYGICSMDDGDSFSEDGWSAVVRRAMPMIAAAQVESIESDPVDLDCIRRRIGPVPASHIRRAAVAVTDLVKAIHGREVSARKDQTPRAKAGVSSRQRGSIIHAFFERWDFQSSPDAAIASVLRAEALDDADASALREDVARSAARLLASPLGARIARTSQLLREVQFTLRIDGTLAKGTADLLVDGNTIVDYKTGAPSADELAEYGTQLQLYGAALHELTGVERIEAYLVLLDVDGECVREVDASPPSIRHVLAKARAALPTLAAQCAAE